MNSIRRLQKGLHSSLRSSVVLFDLPRVVEELTYNSVDAGATKVNIFLSVGACYVKVEDDGCGITRDGLVIFGERNATSKIHLLSDIESDFESLGFRGEALASLSDISLVEVRTKARGRPNSYCKIIKGSKCLFLGIDDQRVAVGTTVIVRDLFYNQPVRRKCMQSSSKRVLHCVKKCVLRIALVHPQVSFKMTDIESEDELLCTMPSPSPLPLVADGFGNEVSSSLHEIFFSDQTLMLSGYMSGLDDSFSTKAFQYLYINSRYVCKGPIHNLLNNLATSSHCSLSQQKVEPEFHMDKRRKTQGYPAYLLNLCCPLSSYDLHFEPSKTIVEFKDWSSVLSFFEQAIKCLWEQSSAKLLQGKSFTDGSGVSIECEGQTKGVFSTDIPKSNKMRKPKCDIQLHQKSTSKRSSTSPWDESLEDINAYLNYGISCEQMQRSPLLKQCQSKTGYVGQTDYSSQHIIHDKNDVFSSSIDSQIGCADDITRQLTNDVSSSLLENHLFSDENFKFTGKFSHSRLNWKSVSIQGSRSLKEESNQRLLTCDPYEILDNSEDKFPLDCASSCSKLEIGSWPALKNEQGSISYHPNYRGFDADDIGKDFTFSDTVDHAEANADKVSSIVNSLFQETRAACMPSFVMTKERQTSKELDVSLGDMLNPFSLEESCFPGENNLHDGEAASVWAASSNCWSPEANWYSGSPHASSTGMPESVNDIAQGYNLTSSLRSLRNVGCSTIEGKSEIINSVEFLPVSYRKSKLGHDYYLSPERHLQSGFPSNETITGKISSSGKLNKERVWSLLENENNNDAYCKYDVNISVQNQDEKVKSLWGEHGFQKCWPSSLCRLRARRSCSAPPFCRGKHKFSILNARLTTKEGKDSILGPSYDSKSSPETLCSSQPSCASKSYIKPTCSDFSQPGSRECVDEELITCEMKWLQSNGVIEKAQCSDTDEMERASTTFTKWRTGIPLPTGGGVPHNYPEKKDDILSICSGLLHLSGSSLVPNSITKDCLEDAKVLLQLDKKFIPVMASRILVIIDQHAADERIRLEELRQKVLSGEGRNITYLDSEMELILPEMGFQLLQKYAEQIEKWGWICNIQSQCLESFAKNMKLLKRRACGVTLIAVPCILGVNLTDKDLIEFINQLVETDGTSALPPSVLRILNFKACRGAIMFGDPLLPTECSLIVEELKATSLCFQCAHGRPTTVPLVDIASLREELAKLEIDKGGPEETWHGLRRHVPSIERAQLRLESAKRFHGE